MMEKMLSGGAIGGFAVIGALINTVIYSVFGMLGGLLGVAIFKEERAPAAAPDRHQPRPRSRAVDPQGAGLPAPPQYLAVCKIVTFCTPPMVSCTRSTT